MLSQHARISWTLWTQGPAPDQSMPPPSERLYLQVSRMRRTAVPLQIAVVMLRSDCRIPSKILEILVSIDGLAFILFDAFTAEL